MSASQFVDDFARTDRISSIDGLRAVAFLAVFSFHTWEYAGSPYIPVVSGLVSQNIRPDFFVVLTGFVLALPFARNPLRLGTFEMRSYMKRRLRRIVPAYYVGLLIAILLPQTLVIALRLSGRSASWQDLPSVGDVAAHMTFSHLFFVDYWASMNGSLWTMSLEMQLYLLFPLIVILLHRFGPAILVGAALVAVVFRIGVSLFVDGPSFPDQFLWAASGLGRLMEFVAGVATALLVFSSRRVRLARPQVLALVVCGALSYLLATNGTLNRSIFPLREVFLSIMFGILIYLSVTIGRFERVLAWRPLSGLGYVAYSLFLVHQPIAWYLSEGLNKFAGIDDGVMMLLLLWTLGLAAVFLAGKLLFVLVERPSINWSRSAAISRKMPEPRAALAQ